MQMPEHIADKKAKQKQKQYDKKIISQKKFNEAKKKNTNDDKPKAKKKKAKPNKKLYKENVTMAKTIAKIRDWYICQRCWATTNIHWSHIINEARDHRLSTNEYNIKALCHNCHLNRRHKNPVEAGDWFKTKRPWRWERLQTKHIRNRSEWKIPPDRHEKENIRLKELLEYYENKVR